mmetsp:Transcript_23980/g.51143  ORF Transcript_23980/g.51143 Transcript_23980/m.51143 type:complete len:204 (+) Transcript_23980:453-1064(+)
MQPCQGQLLSGGDDEVGVGLEILGEAGRHGEELLPGGSGASGVLAQLDQLLHESPHIIRGDLVENSGNQASGVCSGWALAGAGRRRCRSLRGLLLALSVQHDHPLDHNRRHIPDAGHRLLIAHGPANPQHHLGLHLYVSVGAEHGGSPLVQFEVGDKGLDIFRGRDTAVGEGHQGVGPGVTLGGRAHPDLPGGRNLKTGSAAR